MGVYRVRLSIGIQRGVTMCRCVSVCRECKSLCVGDIGACSTCVQVCVPLVGVRVLVSVCRVKVSVGVCTCV